MVRNKFGEELDDLSQEAVATASAMVVVGLGAALAEGDEDALYVSRGVIAGYLMTTHQINETDARFYAETLIVEAHELGAFE